MSKKESVIVLGGGVAGLTAAALLAHEGIKVILIESHFQVGGCAGTFKRGEYIFEVGATQLAGLEPGGIHERIFRHLKCSLPEGRILDPACVVHLGDEKPPVNLWYDPKKWKEERQRQFPGSERFWSTCEAIHKNNWLIANRNPVLPVRNFWDFQQLSKALYIENIPIACLAPFSVVDLLRFTGCHQDLRLRKFLDLQLKLYSQEPAHRTAALYGATVLQMSQSPLGLWHLEGSMQKLSDLLMSSFIRDGGQLLLSHRIVRLVKGRDSRLWRLDIIDNKNRQVQMHTSDVICSLPPQSLPELMPPGCGLPIRYLKRLETLSQPSGALVLYAAINRLNLPRNCPTHIQLHSQELGSIFISISQDGDGRAPIGQATVIASAFTTADYWISLNKSQYVTQKEEVLLQILKQLNSSLDIPEDSWLHKELATPQSFARWTRRPKGIVGGLGQTPLSFGPFGLASRTPMTGLWLCGDSIYPGEGTAGVSQSALMACRQLLAARDWGEINLAI